MWPTGIWVAPTVLGLNGGSSVIAQTSSALPSSVATAAGAYGWPSLVFFILPIVVVGIIFVFALRYYRGRTFDEAARRRARPWQVAALVPQLAAVALWFAAMASSPPNKVMFLLLVVVEFVAAALLARAWWLMGHPTRGDE
jgi:hypothetical protein